MSKHLLAKVEHAVDRLRYRHKDRTDPLAIQAFRGYGNRNGLWLKGRVLENDGALGLPETEPRGPVALERMTRMLRRFETDEVPGATVVARIAGQRVVVHTDEEGYFELRLENTPADAPWTRVELELLDPDPNTDGPCTAVGHVRIAGPTAKLGVISDMDDTVIRTGATSLFRHAATVLLNDAHSREAFPGAAELYTGLSQDETHPFFYLSSSPWNIYDVFEEFLAHHGFPPGPILLKDFGIDEHKLLKRGHVDYKVERIERILETYPQLPFLLIGDSGQKDADVYRTIGKRHPERVLAVYLRDVTTKRDPHVEDAKAALADVGIEVVLADDTEVMAHHARDNGWL